MGYVDEIACAVERQLAITELVADGDDSEIHEFICEYELSSKTAQWAQVPDRGPDAVSEAGFLPSVQWWELEIGAVIGQEDSEYPSRWIIPPGLDVPEVKDFRPVEICEPVVPREIRHALAAEIQRQEDKIIGGCEAKDFRPFFLCGLEIGFRLATGENVDIARAVRECVARSRYAEDSPVVTYDEPPLVPRAV